jgi:MYXO-CTERM domain-containing protein
MITNRTLTLVPFVLLAALAACSSSPGGSENIGTNKARVIKGKPSDASQDAVVMLVHYDPQAGEVGSCTGTLLAPNLVLTARHCVAITDQYAACSADGTPIAAGVVKGNSKPETLYVFKGAQRPNFYGGRIKPDGQGAKIIDDGGKNLCNHDIALVLLKEPIADAKIAPIRLDGDVTKGEIITAVGWGYTDKGEPDVRQQRTGVKITEVGPDKSDFPGVPPNEFQVGESICSGDSGGPAIDSETGAVVGVVSRGGNAQGQNQQDPAAGCIGAQNLYTKAMPFKDMILGAYELAEAEPWIEGQPDPRLLKPGSACTDGAECRSNLCLADPSKKGETTCAEDCSAAECADPSMKCVTEGEAHVCRAPKKDGNNADGGGGCAVSSTSGAPGGAGFAIAIATFGLLALRRRRVGV